MQEYSDQQPQHQGILHNTNQKYHQLAGSLILTSTLISQKNKILKLRQHSRNLQTYINHQCDQLLSAHRIPLVQLKKMPRENYATNPILSNLNTLKHHAKMLEKDEIQNLGKIDNLREIKYSKEQQNHKKITNLMEQMNQSTVYRKPNKRKIVKGRPEMLAMLKKRKLLLALLEEEKLYQKQNHQDYESQLKEISENTLDRNNLLKYISQINQFGSNKNLLETFLQEKVSSENKKNISEGETFKNNFTKTQQNHFKYKTISEKSTCYDHSDQNIMKAPLCRKTSKSQQNKWRRKIVSTNKRQNIEVAEAQKSSLFNRKYSMNFLSTIE